LFRDMGISSSRRWNGSKKTCARGARGGIMPTFS
jgi:hypothetical protein